MLGKPKKSSVPAPSSSNASSGAGASEDNRSEGYDKGTNLIRKVGSLWESNRKPGSYYVRADDYFGDLIFHERKTGKYYKVLTLQCYEPTAKGGNALPAGLQYNVCLNLTNAKACELIGEDE